MPLALLLALAVGQGPRLDPSELARHAQFLSSAALEGRMTPSPGLQRASEYIASEFKRIGLREALNKGYFWSYDVSIGQRPSANNKLVFERPDGKRWSFALGTEFAPVFGSTDNTMVRGELVFVGYGASEKDYEIEADEGGGKMPFDVKGRVVMMLTESPPGEPAMSRAAKAEMAKGQGAVGVIFVGPSAPGRAQLPRTVRGQGLAPEAGIVAVGMSEAAVSKIIEVPTMRTIANLHQSRPLPFSAQITTETVPNSGKVRDVVGYLPGTDPKLKDEFVVIGAHYDHLGYGETGSRTQSDAIHFGADDNASGTAAVLALASHFAKERSNRRTLVFVLFSGEEVGLLGSEAWAKGHPNTIERTAAMVNIDMIGRLRNRELFVYGTSTWDGWEDLLGKVSVPGVELKLGAQTRGDSDQASFARRNVPVLFFNTGLHDEYHTERDTFATLDVTGMAHAVEAIAQTVERIDRLPSRPTFSKDAVLGNLPGDRSAEGSQRKIRVGLIPDMVAGGPGVRITGVSPKSPAESAGLKEGDRVVEFNGKKVEDLQSLQDSYLTAKPGDTVKVVFVRDGVRREILLTVEGR